jgi:1-acyl-sn-glycerol-3-phosphate acyltransferase
METLFKPLPYLDSGMALLLRLLMIPNLFLVRSEGFENLPKDEGPVIYVFNHNNSLESLLVPVFLMFHLGGRTVSFVIDWMYGKIPVLGWLMKMIDPLYVYHKRSRFPLIEKRRPAFPLEGVVDRCCARLGEGCSIGIFPEGRRNRHPRRLARAKPGIGHIILRSGMPVVPVGIDFPLRKQKGRIPVFGRMVLRAGEPLEFRESAQRYASVSLKGNGRAANRFCHALAVETSHTVMRHLSGLCGKSYEEVLPSCG